MKAAEGTMDLIINTVSANHQAGVSYYSYFHVFLYFNLEHIQVSTYLPLLAWKGKIIQLGLVMEPHEVNSYDVTCHVGYVYATQEPSSASR